MDDCLEKRAKKSGYHPARVNLENRRMFVERQPSLRVLFISGYTDYATFEPTIADKVGRSWRSRSQSRR